MKQELYATEVLKEQEGMALYSTENVPSTIEEIRRLSVVSEKPFVLNINEKIKQKAKKLQIVHTGDLTIENIRGMKSIGYIAPLNTVSPSVMAKDMILTTISGGFDVSGYQKLPELARLNKGLETGKEVVKIKDPRYVKIDENIYMNLDTVGVSKIVGKVALSKY
jgi:hypothetical protein